MTKSPETTTQPSAAEELQSVVDDILSSTTLADTTKTIAAAKELGIEPSSLQIVGEARNIEAIFAEAIGPIKAALASSTSPTREDIANMVKANELLDKLIAINAGDVRVETEVTADTILQGFKKLEDGVIEFTLPLGTTIEEAGEILNAAAREKGMEYPVFYDGDKEFWQKNEANAELQTTPGRTYQFKIPTDSISKTRAKQERDYGEGAPLGAIAIAEACERLNTENRETLFKNGNGDRVWVRGSASGVALCSSSYDGVFVPGYDDDGSDGHVAFASSVSARN